ncbi:MAG TPA: hypothetical protein VG498_04240, partial [Terriglobales bacterium]|nr:hypothetical protein [Terriglobales bacterium]
AKTDPAFSKIQLLRYRLQRDSVNSSVLLIGVDEEQPLTILEGNHRLAAAMLVAPRLVHTSFRVLIGLSPHMYQSCWYDTNIPTLWNYLKNRLRNIVDKEADVQRLVAGVAEPGVPDGLAADLVKTRKAEAK